MISQISSQSIQFKTVGKREAKFTTVTTIVSVNMQIFQQASALGRKKKTHKVQCLLHLHKETNVTLLSHED